jgi:hypothetical protein
VQTSAPKAQQIIFGGNIDFATNIFCLFFVSFVPSWLNLFLKSPTPRFAALQKTAGGTPAIRGQGAGAENNLHNEI